MRNIITILLALTAFTSFAQHKVGEQVKTLVEKNTTFRAYAPFTVTSAPRGSATDKVVEDAVHAKIKKALLKHIVASQPGAIELSLPYNGSTVTVQLYKVDIYAEGFHADTDKQQYVAYEKGVHYRGIVKGDYESVAAFNFFRDEMNGIVSDDSLGNLVVGKLEVKDNVEDYIIYSDAKMLVQNDFSCSAPNVDFTEEEHAHRSTDEAMSDRCVTLYFEVDHDIYLQRFSSLTATLNWMSGVFNNVQTLFANDGITTALKSVFVWTEPDPYTGDSSGDYLFQFNQQRPVFDGDVGQLVGIDPGGLGGVAVTIGGICSANNFSYSDVNIVYSQVPAYSWTVQVITHEFGHLFGSPHTHGCYWNGNNTAIDGCGSSQGFTEGNCPQGPIPSSTVRGTIMSYCHLTSAGISFNNGFGPQPAARILNHVESRTCLSTDCVNTCINTITGFSVNSQGTSAIITWEDTGSGPWQVAYATFNGTFSNWETATTNSFTATGLTPGAYYRIAVRPLCVTGLTTTSEQLIFAIDTDVCSGVTFTDTGGLTGNYGNNQRLIRTFRPANPGQKVIVTFNNMNLEQDYDYMYLYQGPDTNAQLYDIFTGNYNPGSYQSAAPDGSFTFEFISDQFVTEPGWNITVTCTALSVAENTFTDFSYYPNPSKGIVTIKSGDEMNTVAIYNVAGQLLMQRQMNATETTVDIASFAEGVYFFKVTGGGKEANFRIVKQN